MAKKKSAVAYTPPQNSVLDSTLTQIQLKVIPPYPDKGVSYARYSKNQIGNNDYELKYQQAITRSHYHDNSGTPEQIGISLSSGSKKFYLTNVILTVKDDSAIVQGQPKIFQLGARRSGTTGTYDYFFDIFYINTTSATTVVVNLNTPIEFFGDYLVCLSDSQCKVGVTVIGWLE